MIYPESLPVNASNPGTIQAGDLMLYGSRTVGAFLQILFHLVQLYTDGTY